MRQETRFKFNAYLSRVAELNGIDAGDVSKKFTVEPSVTQTLMNTMQESSDFLTRINIVPVSEMKGEKIGIGVTGSIASTTDTAGGTERQPKDFSKLASNKYECDQVNFDFYIRYKTLDLWARYQDFQLRIRNAIIKRQSLDFIMAGFNGVKRAETSDRSSNPMLQDVAVGWLQKYRNEAPARVMSKVTDEEGRTTSEVIRVGKGGDYASLDALVMDATNKRSKHHEEIIPFTDAERVAGADAGTVPDLPAERGRQFCRCLGDSGDGYLCGCRWYRRVCH